MTELAAVGAEEDGSCNCDWCSGTSGFVIITRGKDEYIAYHGRVLTCYGAPVRGSEGAGYRLHEDIIRPIEEGHITDIDKHFEGCWWPKIPGIFADEEAVDLYRVKKLFRTLEN